MSSCTTTTIALSSRKPFDDPGIRLPVSTVLTWVELWHKLPAVRIAPVTVAWLKIQAAMLARLPSQRWAKVCGPASAAVVTLLEIGWTPQAPDTWLDEEGQAWVLSKGISSSDIKFKLSEAVAKQQWTRAARFHGGSGLEAKGPDLTTWSKLHGERLKNKAYDEAGMQATIAAGGFWTSQRRHRAALATTACWRCGAKAEDVDDLHTFWTCVTFRNDSAQHIQCSQHLLGTAVRLEHPCFWLRGLVPATLTHFDIALRSPSWSSSRTTGSRAVRYLTMREAACRRSWHLGSPLRPSRS